MMSNRLLLIRQVGTPTCHSKHFYLINACTRTTNEFLHVSGKLAAVTRVHFRYTSENAHSLFENKIFCP